MGCCDVIIKEMGLICVRGGGGGGIFLQCKQGVFHEQAKNMSKHLLIFYITITITITFTRYRYFIPLLYIVALFHCSFPLLFTITLY